jgi:hypothetical protein
MYSTHACGYAGMYSTRVAIHACMYSTHSTHVAVSPCMYPCIHVATSYMYDSHGTGLFPQPGWLYSKTGQEWQTSPCVAGFCSLQLNTGLVASEPDVLPDKRGHAAQQHRLARA